MVYRLSLTVAFPLLVVYLLFRGFRDLRYFPRIWERLGFLPHAYQGTASGAVWLHAVSVGEVMAAVRLLKEIRAEYPARRVYVSSTTLAGRALAEEKLSGLVDGVFYAPVDYALAVRRVLRRLRPSLVIALETEIWPNWYREVKRTGAALLVANGRISDKAIPSYRRWTWFLRHALMWPDLILAQNDLAVARYRELGAPPERIRNAGNLKYDFDPKSETVAAEIRQVIERAAPSQVWIAASTMPPARPGDVDEDDVVIEAFERLAAGHSKLLLLLVPRRPGRFDAAAAKLEAAGIPFLRRSQLTGEENLALPGVLLLDSIGELSGLFPVGDVVFMGGTLAERGGHNILEPAFFGRPVIVGPHMENFPDIAERFRSERAVVEIGGADELAGAVDDLLRDSGRGAQLGSRARELAEAEHGATARVMEEVRRMTAVSVTHVVWPLLARVALEPLTWLWRLGGNLKRSRQMARRRKLKTPVISVGGIGMGGVGKTPFTLHLAERLKHVGYSPAILIRGYRRRVPQKYTVLEAGTSARSTLTGDEAQLFVRSGIAHVGIGADRYQTGTVVEEQLNPDVMLLDDGFQHWRLARSLDFVLIDALDPFAGDALFPLGRLREPLEQLARADAFVITRAELGSPIEGVIRKLRNYNREAPVFISRVVPLSAIEVATGNRSAAKELATKATAAFCALANPASFWRSLGALHCKPSHCWTFGDHHHYVPRDLQRMGADATAAGAEILLTTEKDLMNLPPDAAALVAPLKLAWLQIGMSFDDEDGLMKFVRARVPGPVDAAVPPEAGPPTPGPAASV
jgi:3-deoxy-D-manno-octulosonic-acid transferase